MRMHRPLIAIAAAGIVVLLLVIGLSQAPKTDTNPPATGFSLARARQALKGSPAPLAALHAQGGRLLGGGEPAVRAQLAALRGTPILVNKWASWCGPCRAEFPFLQQASVTYGKQIAFLGLNSGDSTASARAFLRRFPVPYPSFEDPKEHIAAAFKAGTAYPITIFFDADGTQVTLHQGGYPTQAKLNADIERYLKPAAG